ncbi:hypothetical protein H0H93_005957, partial [Arthromyces matolae]
IASKTPASVSMLECFLTKRRHSSTIKYHGQSLDSCTHHRISSISSGKTSLRNPKPRYFFNLSNFQ